MQNVALFLRFSLPFTLISHVNGAFCKTLFKLEEFENAGFSFSCRLVVKYVLQRPSILWEN